MELSEAEKIFWIKIEAVFQINIPCHIKNTFRYKFNNFSPCDFAYLCSTVLFCYSICSFCGYSNLIAFKKFSENDLLYIENMTRTELLRRITEKCKRMKIDVKKIEKANFFGTFASNIHDFNFSEYERSMIFTTAEKLRGLNPALSQSEEKLVIDKSKSVKNWFCDANYETKKEVIAPAESQKLLLKMMEISERNAPRPKHGYRYDDQWKRFTVANRILSGPMAYKLQQSNLKGCYPSISTTNRYIHKSNHAIVEGELLVNDLKDYLTKKNQPMWVSLSEDGTRVENRLQYDSKTDQLVGYVLPLNGNGMPMSYSFKARTASEMLIHFMSNTQVANNVNTIMAKPLGNAPAFCILLFGTHKYVAQDIANRWNYVVAQLAAVGIRVLSIASDSDPKNNSAMRKNSELGSYTEKTNEIFKSGFDWEPPFYCQDFPHLATKLRNLFLTTIKNSELLPFGRYFIQQQHIQQLLDRYWKDEHLLTATTLDPRDKMNYESAKKICDGNVIKLLRAKVKNSEGTAIFLEIMSDVVAAFEDKEMSPTERLSKMWYSAFLVRIWRKFILNEPGLTLKKNFMSTFCYNCIELNCHSLVKIILFLKKENLTHLFHPYMYSSQPCESFYRRIRSLSTVNSTVVNCSTKQMLDRLNRIQLLGEIASEKNGFKYPESLISCRFSESKYIEADFPSEDEIHKIILQCKDRALETAQRVGLIEEDCDYLDSVCDCCVPKYVVPKQKNVQTTDNENSVLDESSIEFIDLEGKLICSKLKNFAYRFEKKDVPKTYAEIIRNKRRFVYKKTSICWLFSKESYKLSSDRIYRVRDPYERKKKKAKKTTKASKEKTVKTHKIYKKYVPRKTLLKKHK